MSTTDPLPALEAARRRAGLASPDADSDGSRLPFPEELRLLASGRVLLLPLTLVASVGLLVLSVGLALSRSNPGSNWAELLFWVGLVVLVVPFASWLAGVGPTRGERLVALVVLGVLLYLVKVVHDPYAFVYSDEWVHVYNVQEILRSGALFHANPLIAVTARYPGLEAVTAGVASTTGLSVFASGLVVLCVARVALVLALFMVFERLTGSARIASIAGVVYVTNPNFVFWSAQFSYESLALPLIALAAAATISAMRSPRRPPGTPWRWTEGTSWTVVACLAALATVATHHLSSWALCVFLIATCLIAWARPQTRSQAPWLIAGVAVVATALWFALVAPGTGTYLFPVMGRAIHQTWDTLLGRTSGRGLFESAGGTQAEGQVAATWQRAFAVASVALVVIGLPFGLRTVWRKYRSSIFVLALAIAAVVYVAVVPMRLVPAAWETSNRSSEFLFVGVALVLGLAGLTAWSSRRFVLGAAACVGILLIGGIVAGWPPRVLLSQPYRVQAQGAVVTPQPALTAWWAKNVLGPGQRFIAPQAVGREILVHGGETTFVTDASFDARTVLYGRDVTAGVVNTLGNHAVSYVAIDRQASADDSMAGYFFQPAGQRDYIDPVVTRKYDSFPGVDRVLDLGDIVVYDVNRLWNVSG
jgi:hypothetical protein